ALLAHGLITAVASETELIIELFTHVKNLAKFVFARLEAGQRIAHVASRIRITQLILLIILWPQCLGHLGLALRAESGQLCAIFRIAETAIGRESALHLAIFCLE